MRRLLGPWDCRAGPPDSHSPARTDLLSRKEAVKYLGVKLSLLPLHTLCVSPPVFKVCFSIVFAWFSVSQYFAPQLCTSGTPVQTRLIVDDFLFRLFPRTCMKPVSDTRTENTGSYVCPILFSTSRFALKHNSCPNHSMFRSVFAVSHLSLR